MIRSIFISFRHLRRVDYNYSNTDVNGRMGTDKRPGTTRVSYAKTSGNVFRSDSPRFFDENAQAAATDAQPSETFDNIFIVDRALDARTAAQIYYAVCFVSVYDFIGKKCHNLPYNNHTENTPKFHKSFMYTPSLFEL